MEASNKIAFLATPPAGETLMRRRVVLISLLSRSNSSHSTINYAQQPLPVFNVCEENMARFKMDTVGEGMAVNVAHSTTFLICLDGTLCFF